MSPHLAKHPPPRRREAARRNDRQVTRTAADRGRGRRSSPTKVSTAPPARRSAAAPAPTPPPSTIISAASRGSTRPSSGRPIAGCSRFATVGRGRRQDRRARQAAGDHRAAGAAAHRAGVFVVGAARDRPRGRRSVGFLAIFAAERALAARQAAPRRGQRADAARRRSSGRGSGMREHHFSVPDAANF